MRLFKKIGITALLLLISSLLSAQEYNLKIFAKDSLDQQVLKSIAHKNKFKTETALIQEFQKIEAILKRKGYFSYQYTIAKTKNTFTYKFNLQKKTNTVLLTDSTKTVVLAIENLEEYLLKKSEEQENKGNSFSEIRLRNITTKNDTLFAELTTTKTKSRTITQTIIKGYAKFPQSHVKNYLRVDSKTIPSNNTLNRISSAIETLPFVKQTRAPSFLFSKDSTLLYLYLKRKKSSYFDGLINISSNETSKKIEVIGYLDLKLENSLNGGEVFTLKWEKLKKRSENFNLYTKVPYVFNTKITADADFEIFKKDTSFVTTSFRTALQYPTSNKTTLGVTFESSNSTNISSNLEETVDDFKSYFFGTYYQYMVLKKSNFFSNTKFLATLKPSYGSRISDGDKNEQLKLETEIHYLWEINPRNGLFTTGIFKHLVSKNTLTNELFRIGGEGTIRGIDPQSIFTTSFGVFNSEYHYKTTEESSIYAILDLGIYKIDKRYKTAQGIGIGYKQNISNNLLTFSYTIGKKDSAIWSFDNSFLAIKVISFL